MSYRCDICTRQSRPGQPKLRHAIKRWDGQIARELAVCTVCNRELLAGARVKQLRAAFVAQTTTDIPDILPEPKDPPTPIGQPAARRESLT